MTETLRGAVFKGKLEPPDGEAYAVTYRFHETASLPPIPQQVKRQRQIMRLPVQDISCISAFVSIPALGLDREEVVVSTERPSKDGSQKLLLQSLKRPELGVTVLRLEPGGDELIGGEEDWEPGQPPLIQASRSVASPVTSPKATQQQPIKPQAPPPAGSRRPQPGAKDKDKAVVDAVVNPVIPGPPLYPDPFAFDPDEEERRAEAAAAALGPLAPIDGGVGRSGMDFGGRPPPRQSAPLQRTSAENDDADLRPDLATGAPGGQMGATDADLHAAEAERVQRLIAAVANGETGDVRQLLARMGPNYVAPAGSKYSGMTPLMVAAERGRDTALELLLEKRADVDASDAQGWTALMYSIHGQRTLMMQRLLEARSNVNVVAAGDEQRTPLLLASAGARHELLSGLLKARSSLETVDSSGRRAMHVAAQTGRGAQLSLLLAARARVEEVDVDGHTPLLAAAASGRAECVKILISARASIEAVDREGRSAESHATTFGHGRVLDVLTTAAASASNAGVRRSRS